MYNIQFQIIKRHQSRSGYWTIKELVRELTRIGSSPIPMSEGSAFLIVSESYKTYNDALYRRKQIESVLARVCRYKCMGEQLTAYTFQCTRT